MSEATKKEIVERRFRKGMALFEYGHPCPPDNQENRLESCGWRYAKRIKLDYEDTLAQLYYAYAGEVW